MRFEDPQPQPLSSLTERDILAIRGSVRLIATDVDGTLTTGGKLQPTVTHAIKALDMLGIEVLLVSGRPAGELQGLVRYLPCVRRGIAENGLLLVVPDRAPEWIDGATDTGRLRAIGEQLNRDHEARLVLTGDSYCRLGDVAYERDGRDVTELLRLRDVAEGLGVHFIWSNVHVHLAQEIPDKGAAVLKLLKSEHRSPESVLTVGDAPNDAGLFVADRFGVSVGTAEVLEQLGSFSDVPRYVTDGREGAAFLEVAALLGVKNTAVDAD